MVWSGARNNCRAGLVTCGGLPTRQLHRQFANIGSTVSSIYLALLASKSPAERLIQNIFNNPFAGIHQLAWFDWAMLVPYFTVLIVLSVYGLHRYDIIRTYFKHKKKKTVEPAKRFDQLPRVTIQLPLYNERYVVERLIEEVVKVEYP